MHALDRWNRSALWLALGLAALPAFGQMPSLATYRPGIVHLELSGVQPSEVEVDLDALEDAFCATTASRKSEIRPPGETCRLVIANDGSHGRGTGPISPLTASAGLLAALPCNDILVSVIPTGLSLAGEAPIHLSCGSVKFWMELSGSAPVVPSTLTLVRPALGASTSLFYGTLGLTMDVTYSFSGTELELTETRFFALDVSGRWTLAPPAATALLLPAESNLALFVDRDTVADVQWMPKTGCGQARKGCTHLCLVAAEGVVDALNGVH